jgi:hypothetical protein
MTMLASEHIGQSSRECAETTAAERNRIVQQASRVLRDRSQAMYAAVDFTFVGGILIITGRVPSFYLKQLVQEALSDIEGVQGIENRIDVVNQAGRSSVRHR